MSYSLIRPLGLAPEPMSAATKLAWFGIIGAVVWMFWGTMRPARKAS